MKPRPSCPRKAVPELAHEHRDFRVYLEILRRQLQNSVETGERAVLALAGDLLEIDRELTSIDSDVKQPPAAALARIEKRLAAALGRIQFHDTVKQQTETIILALRRLDGFAARLGSQEHTEPTPGRGLRPVSELLQDLYASYISEQQRSIHEASLACTDAPFAELRPELP